MCFLSSWLILLASLNRRATLYRSVLPDSRSPLRRVMDIISDLRCFTSSILCAAFCFSVSKNSKSLDPLAESGWLATYITQTRIFSPTSFFKNQFFFVLHIGFHSTYFFGSFGFQLLSLSTCKNFLLQKLEEKLASIYIMSQTNADFLEQFLIF